MNIKTRTVYRIYLDSRPAMAARSLCHFNQTPPQWHLVAEVLRKVVYDHPSSCLPAMVRGVGPDVWLGHTQTPFGLSKLSHFDAFQTTFATQPSGSVKSARFRIQLRWFCEGNVLCSSESGCPKRWVNRRLVLFKGWRNTQAFGATDFILLMEEILHHLGCIKPCK